MFACQGEGTKEVEHTYWAEGYPTNSGSNVVMDRIGRPQHLWTDRDSDETHHIVCQLGK